MAKFIMAVIFVLYMYTLGYTLGLAVRVIKGTCADIEKEGMKLLLCFGFVGLLGILIVSGELYGWLLSLGL